MYNIPVKRGENLKTLDNIEAIQSLMNEELSMIIAKSHHCSTCKMINAHLENTIKDFDQLNVAQVFVDDVEAFRGEYVVFSVPTVLIYSQGKELLRESRFIDITKINRLLAMAKQ